jgi:hypothetical protein
VLQQLALESPMTNSAPRSHTTGRKPVGISEYAENTYPPLDKNSLDYQPLKSAVSKMIDQKEIYDKERRNLYSALAAYAASAEYGYPYTPTKWRTYDSHIDHSFKSAQTIARNTIALLELLHDHCSKNAIQSIITQRKNWELLRQ